MIASRIPHPTFPSTRQNQHNEGIKGAPSACEGHRCPGQTNRNGFKNTLDLPAMRVHSCSPEHLIDQHRAMAS